jgi:phosphoribosylformylglycinamidine synthase subunit PurL
VTGGNVSFYNQSGETQIHPTPVIGMVGILDDASKRVGIAWPADHDIVLLGETRAELGGSEWAWVAHQHLGGTPPALDLDAERRLLELLAGLAERNVIASAHDCSEGGLGVTLAECAIASNVGAVVGPPADLPPHVWLFSESASRVVVAAPRAQAIIEMATVAGIPSTVLGRTGGARLVVSGLLEVPVADLAAAYEGGLPRLLG